MSLDVLSFVKYDITCCCVQNEIENPLFADIRLTAISLIFLRKSIVRSVGCHPSKDRKKYISTSLESTSNFKFRVEI